MSIYICTAKHADGDILRVTDDLSSLNRTFKDKVMSVRLTSSRDRVLLFKQALYKGNALFLKGPGIFNLDKKIGGKSEKFAEPYFKFLKP